MSAEPIALIGDYSAVLLDEEEFAPLFRQYRPRVFANTLKVFPGQLMSEGEKKAVQDLSRRLGTLYRLNLGIYHDGQFIGWSFGVQADEDRFSMINTGILPDHQGKGVYTALLPRILEILQAQGFQVVFSRHVVTNNRVLVPKLKAGFVITHLELSDTFGLLVHLSYFFNPRRRKLLDFRAGQLAPDDELKGLLEL
jgi:GNAT superfamily N-acetyltransferase